MIISPHTRSIRPAAAAGYAITATGGTTTDVNIAGRNYRLHTFTSSGDFVVTSIGTGGGGIEYLLIGAGGGASWGDFSRYAGGAGAGRMIEGTGTVSVSTYAVVVGTGGAGGTGSGTPDGTNGGDSSFFGDTSAGGGYGSRSAAGGNGGSGGAGGGIGNNGVAVGSTGFGNNGGWNNNGWGASGGGAGGAGAGNGSANVPPGAGRANSITGTSVTYCVGGAGGDGSFYSDTTTYGSGGRGRGTGTGQTGVNGVLIVRYPLEA